MDIELTTTTKKLTITIVNQMLFAKADDLALMMNEPDRVFGYVVVKGAKFALLKGVDDWKKISIDYPWKAAVHTPYECVSRNRFLRFNTEQERDEFLVQYARLLELATTHIYI